jgi:hypothetical protein
MSITATCPKCGFSGTTPDSFRGKTIKCRKCGGSFVVGAAPAATTAPQLAPAAAETETPTPDTRRSKNWVLRAALFGMLFGVCVGVAGTVAVYSWVSPRQGSGQQAKADSRNDSQPPPDSTKGGLPTSAETPKENPAPVKPADQDAVDRETVAQFIKKNAEDPGNLEIVEFGRRMENSRRVVFRCNQVGRTPPQINSKTGQVIGGTGGAPVKRESMVVEFSPDGKVARAHLDECFCLWSGPLSEPKPEPEKPEKPSDARLTKLEKDLLNADPAARIRAAEELGKLGAAAKPSVRALCIAAAGDSKEVQRAALEALEKIDPKLAKHLITLVAGDERDWRNALNEIGAMGEQGAAAVPLLIPFHKNKLAQKETRSVSVSCLLVLARVGANDGDAIKTVLESTGKIISGLDDLNVKQASPKVATREERQVYSQAQSECLIVNGALFQLSQSKNSLRKEAVLLLTTFLDKLLKWRKEAPLSSMELTITNALRTLGDYGPDAKAAIPVLKELKFDKDMQIREAASAALQKIEK